MIFTCQQFTRSVTDAREGRLSPLQRAGYRFHHTICKHCRAFEDGLATTIALLHEPAPASEGHGASEASEAAPPEGLRAATMARFRQRNRDGGGGGQSG